MEDTINIQLMPQYISEFGKLPSQFPANFSPKICTAVFFSIYELSQNFSACSLFSIEKCI